MWVFLLKILWWLFKIKLFNVLVKCFVYCNINFKLVCRLLLVGKCIKSIKLMVEKFFKLLRLNMLGCIIFVILKIIGELLFFKCLWWWKILYFLYLKFNVFKYCIMCLFLNWYFFVDII